MEWLLVVGIVLLAAAVVVVGLVYRDELLGTGTARREIKREDLAEEGEILG